MDAMKCCPDCKQFKSIAAEYWSGQSLCKQCLKARRITWGKENRTYLRKYSTKRRRAKGIREIRRYSNEEIAYIRDHYPTEDTAAIAQFLGRTKTSVADMAHRLNVQKLDKVSRFWSRVHKTDTCWIWTAGKHKDGYGQVRFHNKQMQAHRVAWELTHGPIPEGLFVCHNCPGGDNPSCVNPAHLWLGTAAENNWDKVQKGRHIKRGK